MTSDSHTFAVSLIYIIAIMVICASAAANLGAGEIEFDLSVGSSQQSAMIAIDSIELSPDENSDQSGIQISPIAAGKKNMTITVNLSVDTGLADSITVSAQLVNNQINNNLTLQKKQDINSTTAIYEAELELDYTLLAGNRAINITATAGNEKTAATASFEWIELAAFEIDSSTIKLNAQPGNSTIILGDSNFSTKDKPTIRNIGNTVINIAFASQGFANSTLDARILSANIKASLETIIGFNSTLSKTLSNSSRTIEAELQPGEIRPLSFSIYAPKTSKLGQYKGNITIVAIIVQ